MNEAVRRLSFAMRSMLKASLPAWKRRTSLDALRPSLDATRLGQLEKQFDFSSWTRLCGEQEWRESLYVLDVLLQVLPADLPPGRGLDVGSKNGAYLPGLVTASPRGWDAVEIDAHRRYLWGSTRRVYGEAMANGLTDCEFISADVRTLKGPYSVVTWFLPFLTIEPLRAWGLPQSQFVPPLLLRHVMSLLAPGGVLLVVNQGEREAALQRQLFETMGCRPQSLGQLDSVLSPFRRPRFAFLWRASGQGTFA
jgi:hypothetical protein